MKQDLTQERVYLEENWDSEGAQAVSPETWTHMEAFLEALPDNFPPSNIMAGIDGSMGLFWSRDKNDLYVDFRADGKIRFFYHYQERHTKDIPLEEKVIPSMPYDKQLSLLMQKIAGAIDYFTPLGDS